MDCGVALYLPLASLRYFHNFLAVARRRGLLYLGSAILYFKLGCLGFYYSLGHTYLLPLVVGWPLYYRPLHCKYYHFAMFYISANITFLPFLPSSPCAILLRNVGSVVAVVAAVSVFVGSLVIVVV